MSDEGRTAADGAPWSGRARTSLSLPDGVYDAGARRLTLGAVILAVGNALGGLASEFLGSVGLGGIGLVVYAAVFVPTVYFAAGEFLRSVGLVVENAAIHAAADRRTQTDDGGESG